MTTLWLATEFIVRLYKQAVGNPDYEWQNVYEIKTASAPGNGVDWEALMEGFIAAERQFHTPNVRYTKATIATWTEDNTPYNPNSFYVFEDGATLGNRAITTDPLARHITLNVKRQVQFGRSGKLHYRGCLAEGDVVTGSDLIQDLEAAARTALQTAANTVFSAMNNSILGILGASSFMAMIDNIAPTNEITFREVTGFQVQGAGFTDPDHKYFDRL